MLIDIKSVPFSRRGSYIAFAHLTGSGLRPSGSFIDFARPVKIENMPVGVYLQTVHGDSPRQEVFHLALLRDGKPVPGDEVVSPTLLQMENEGQAVELCLAGTGLVRIRGTGIGLRLTLVTGVFDHAFLAGDDRWEINSFSNRNRYAVKALHGRINVEAPWNAVLKKSEIIRVDFVPDEKDGTFEGIIEEYTTSWIQPIENKPFDDCLREVEEDYQEWLSRTPDLPSELSDAGELAAYVNWSCIVEPRGHIKRPAIFMSKGIMSSIWSWDHGFNAMALVYKNPQLAWDQFCFPFEHQDQCGCLPDAVNDCSIIWNYTKPPVHGWMLKWMMERTDFIQQPQLRTIYEPLSKWTKWWFTYRDDDRDGIPQYNHGNDCGWDNATVFDGGAPVESADLSTYLILQMETLAEIAEILGYPKDAIRWEANSRELMQRLLLHSWRDDHFISPRSGDHHVSPSDCLINFMPILLGKRLPAAMLQKLLGGLKAPGRFITAHGLATEALNSPFYTSDGYWRGPIWAPTTLMLVDALIQINEVDLARELSRKYCRMVAQSGMAENFDAISGAGLRDKSYTWTSSIFLILAHENW